MAKFVIELDYYEDREEIEAIVNMSRMQHAIFETEEILRTEYKHGEWEDEKVIRLLERLKET